MKDDISTMKINKVTKIKDDRKEMLFSELASLLSSGLDFSRSFTLLIESEDNKNMKSALRSLYEDVIGGSLLYEAMKKSGKFSILDYGVVSIGEETGRLNDSLLFLSSYYSKRTEHRRMVSGAVRYPVIILFTAVIVVIFMLAVVVPMFEDVYARMGSELPGITRKIISLSKSLPRFVLIVALTALPAAAIIYRMRNNAKLRSLWSATVVRIPIAGTLICKNQQNHFCKLLHLLTSSGITLYESIDMLTSIMIFHPYNNSLKHMKEGLSRGEMLSKNMEKFPILYDKKLTALVKMGEETNKLPEVFAKQSEELSKELEFRFKKTGSLLEPVMILFVGVLVAIILISMYLPMFQMGGIMG